MALTKITGQVINTATDVTVGVLTVTDTLAVGGTVSVGGTLTYEDVTNIDSVGLITARDGINVSGGQIAVGSNIKLGNAGVITATSFVGSGANLTGITQTTINNNADNRLITGSGTANTLNGEQFLTFDGDVLTLTKSTTTAYSKSATTNDSALYLINSGAAGHSTIQFQSVSGGSANTGQATISAFNESSGSKNTALTLGTRQNSDSTINERLRITSDGKVGINSASPEAQLMVLQNSTVANSLSFKAAAGQIFRNEDSEFAFGLSNAAPYPLFIQGRDKNNSAKNVAINPLGGLILIGSEKSDYNARLGNKLSIVGTTAYTGMSISNYPGTNASHAPLFDINRSRGTSDGSLTAVVNGDKLGEIIFRGANGSNFADAVALRSYAQTPSGSNVDGKFEISTSQAGTMGVKLGISSEGYVTIPNLPAATAHQMSGAIDTGGEGNIVAVTFTGTITNQGGHYSTSTGKFTVPIDGIYHASCGFLTRKGSATNASHNAFIYKNGSASGIKTRDINSANEQHITAVGLLDCSKGDELQVYVANGGGDFWSDYNYFSVHLVG